MKQLNYQFLVAGLASLGLVISIVDYELQISAYPSVLDDLEYPDALQHPRVRNQCTVLCRLVVALTTAVALVYLLLRQKYKLEWRKRFRCNGERHDPS